MRANTSLLGHILGSHPQIEGYYELQRGYGRRLDLLKNKYAYYSNHTAKAGATYIFDKILHNYLPLSERLISPEDRIIFMIRQPSPTIESIMRLFGDDPDHKWSTLAGAEDYYTKRLMHIKDLSLKFRGRYFFLQAENLIEDPDGALRQLGEYLGLKSPLSKRYQTFKMTGQRGAGDTSTLIKSGAVVHKSSKACQESSLSQRTQKIYLDTLSALRENSQVNCSSSYLLDLKQHSQPTR